MNQLSKLLARLRGKALYAGVFGLIVAILLGWFVARPVPAVAPQPEQTVVTTTIAGPILPASVPVTLRIPRLNLESSFVPPLGLLENGEVAVPDSYTHVGWYKHSPTPGALGPAVILGHVDSYAGPAVFFSLGQLEPGDDVYVDREDGTTAHFKVESLERPSQAAFPTQRVYGNIDHAGLRLITCSGIYVRGTARYTHNLIVYARLVE